MRAFLFLLQIVNGALWLCFLASGTLAHLQKKTKTSPFCVLINIQSSLASLSSSIFTTPWLDVISHWKEKGLYVSVKKCHTYGVYLMFLRAKSIIQQDTEQQNVRLTEKKLSRFWRYKMTSKNNSKPFNPPLPKKGICHRVTLRAHNLT